jgi:hypothetical protein
MVDTAGKVLLIAAAVLALLGLGALALSWLGVNRLPGTLSWNSGNATVYVPLGLMIVVSIVGTIVLNLFIRH